MSCLPTIPSQVGRKCIHSANSHMVYDVMKNWAKACTVHRWGQRVGLLTVDLHWLQARKYVRSVWVQMRQGEATCFPFSSPSMSSKGCGCYASLRTFRILSLSLEMQSHSDKLTRHRKPHSQSSILDHLKYWYFSWVILYSILEPYTLSILGTRQSVCLWFVCCPNGFYTHSSPGCASSFNSMKAHESQSTTVSHMLELCELVLIWYFPVISVSPACWELCFIFLPNTWNSLNWELITSTVTMFAEGVKVGPKQQRQRTKQMET